MIARKRLEELIEKGATIYSNEYGEIQLIKENDLSLYENGQKNYILYALEPNKKYHNEIFDEDLFETKEDADFALEFQNITRTETLNLPTWEEFKRLEISDVFKCKKYNLRLEKDNFLTPPRIVICDEDSGCFIKTFDYTKQDYLEACKIAKKLFLGEEC